MVNAFWRSAEHQTSSAVLQAGDAGPLRLRKTAEMCLAETLIKWFAVIVAAAVFSLAG